jgi:hypothetical protein
VGTQSVKNGAHAFLGVNAIGQRNFITRNGLALTRFTRTQDSKARPEQAATPQIFHIFINDIMNALTRDSWSHNS